MYRKEVNAQSPLRILEKSIHGGLGKGNLGVVMAPAGVGKSACLVQIGLDDLMRDRDVLHVAAGQSVEHVSAWYDALFDDLASYTALADKDGVRASITRHRAIKTFNPGEMNATRVGEALEMFGKHLSLKPKAILVDGFDWEADDHVQQLQTLKAMARKAGAELWVTAQTPRGAATSPKKIAPPCEGCQQLIDVGIFLAPKGGHVRVQLIKDHGDAVPPETHLELHPDTLRLVAEGEKPAAKKIPAADHTLLSGGAPGAEQEFGECAEKWHLKEIHFSFQGRGNAIRQRGLVMLTDEELEEGQVSSAYLKAHMHRTYPQTPLFSKVLQSIWHQVNTAGEVFCVGQIMPDGTVKGGTGWAVELGKHWHKPVFVYDQEQRGWFTAEGNEWKRLEKAPKITRARFCGTGTRFLTDDGREQIQQLFKRSFGAAPKK